MRRPATPCSRKLRTASLSVTTFSVWWAACFLLASFPFLDPGLTAPAVEVRLVPGESVLAARVEATAHSFEARVTRFECAFSMDQATGLPTDGRLQFDFEDVRTGNETRDQEMLQWLDHASHPETEASLLSAESASTGVLARCRLRMHGQENEVVIPLRIAGQEGGWLIEGEATIDHRLWGLPKIRRFLFLSVDPLLRVHFRLHFQPVMPSQAQ